MNKWVPGRDDTTQKSNVRGEDSIELDDKEKNQTTP
jgi:hypothetical protein